MRLGHELVPVVRIRTRDAPVAHDQNDAVRVEAIVNELEGASEVALPAVNRTAWDRGLIAEGQAIVRRWLRIGRPGPYQLQAAINADHADAPTAEATDWRQIVALHDQLLGIAPSAIVALNRAVAVAEVDGPTTGLSLVEALALGDYHLWHAIRADLLARAGKRPEADAAYRSAIERTENAAERRYLERKRAALRRR